MAALQPIGQIRLFQQFAGHNILTFNLGLNLPTLTIISTMTAGTMFAIWLGELISEHGIRNQGLSLIIFSGIVSRIPSNLGRLLADQQQRVPLLVFLAVLTTLTIFVIVYVQEGR